MIDISMRRLGRLKVRGRCGLSAPLHQPGLSATRAPRHPTHEGAPDALPSVLLESGREERDELEACGRRMSLTVLVVGGLLGLALVEVVIRRSDVGAALVIAVLILGEVTPHLDLSIMTNPVRVGPNDLVVIVLLTAAVARLLRARRVAPVHWLIVAFLILIIWSIARGAGPFGFPAAVAEGRKYLQFISALLYFSTVEFRRELLDRFGKLWLIFAIVLCAVTVARWVGNAAGVTSGFFAGYSSVRVIPAAMTLVLAQAAIVAFPLLSQRDRPFARLLTPTLLAFVLLLQHRTVWIATAGGVFYLLWRERTLAKRAFAVLAVALGIIGALSFTVFDDEQGEIREQLSSSAQSTGTLEWRYDGWIALLEDSGPRNTEDLLAGLPFGTGWTRVLSPGRVVDVSPHNFYLETFLRTGALGVALLLAVYVLSLRATNRSDRRQISRGLLSPSFLHVVVAMQLVFYITYSPDFAQAMLLGLAASVAAVGGRGYDHATVPPENRVDTSANLRRPYLP
jgi:hypothetical protein